MRLGSEVKTANATDILHLVSFSIISFPVVCQNPVAKTGRLPRGVRAREGNVPRTRGWAHCVHRSEPAMTSRSKTRRCDNNSSCFACPSPKPHADLVAFSVLEGLNPAVN